jgi:HK97 family phage major capsid protein
MNEKFKTVSQLLTEREALLKKREAVNVSMNEITDKVKAEKREALSAEEAVKYQHLKSEFDSLGREIALNAQQTEFQRSLPEKKQDANAQLREILQAKTQREVTLRREAFNTTDVDAGGLEPLTIKDILPPLESGLIWDKVGIPVQTGVVGKLQWPVMGSVEATIEGESVELNESKLDMTKIVAKKVRLGITMRVNNQAINDTNTDLKALIANQCRMGIVRQINHVAFSHEKFSSDFYGPAKGAKAQVTFAGKVPTFAELISMKGSVAATGVEMNGFCFVMSESLKATLEATPIDNGSGRMVVENNKIAGYPVFCTEFVNYGSGSTKADEQYVLAGCFGYLALNQYGDMRMVIDPYTAAKSDEVLITLNSDWSMTTLRSEAFALGVTKVA